jgi:Ca2+-binding EF-hand superfamily protein
LQEIREAFDLFDSDGSGVVDAREMKIAMRALGFNVRKKELRVELHNMGKEERDLISFDEFRQVISKRMASRDSREEISKVFKLFDDDGTGRISFDKLKRVVQMVGEKLSDEEIQEMIDQADRSGEGAITEADFHRVMKHKGTHLLDLSDED